MSTKANDPCRDKSAADEPLFTLCARDVSSDLCVDFWVRLQLFITKRMEEGLTLDEARLEVEMVLLELFPFDGNRLTPKLDEAEVCRVKMRDWPTRKLAD